MDSKKTKTENTKPEKEKKKKKEKRGCKGCLKDMFVLIVGMITGIIVFVAAIVGTVYVALTAVSVKDLQQTFGVELVPEDNAELLNKNMLQLVQEVIGMASDISNVSIDDILDTFNLPIPNEIEGIDITPLFKYPIFEIPNHVSEVTSNITIDTIARLANIDLASYNIPLLLKLEDETIENAADVLLKKMNGNISLRLLEDDFGIEIEGENSVLENVQDVIISELGGVLDYLTLSDIIDIDSDKFISIEDTALYYYMGDKTQSYIQIDNLSQSNPYSETSVFKADEASGVLDRREVLYIRQKDSDGAYVLDKYGNYVYTVANDFYFIDQSTQTQFGAYVKNESGEFVLDETLDGEIYYRHIEYVPCDLVADMPEFSSIDVKYVKAYINHFTLQNGNYLPEAFGYFEVYRGGFLIGTSTTGNVPSSASEFVAINSLDELNGQDKYFYRDLSALSYRELDSYGIDYGTAEEPVVTDGNSSLTESKTGYLKAHTGTSNKTLQAVSRIQIKNLSDIIDKVKTLKVGELIDIYEIETPEHEKSPQFLIELKDTPLSDLSQAINGLTLSAFIEIDSTSPKLLQALKDSSLSTIETDIANVCLADVIEIDSSSNALLKKIAYTAITDMSDAISSLFNDIVLNDVLNLNLYSAFVSDAAGEYALLEFKNKFIPFDRGDYVLENGNYVYYDSKNPDHALLQRYERGYAYIPSDSGNYVYNVYDETDNPYVFYDLNNSAMPSVADSIAAGNMYYFDVTNLASPYTQITSEDEFNNVSKLYPKMLKGYTGFIKKPSGYSGSSISFTKVYADDVLLATSTTSGTYVIKHNELTNIGTVKDADDINYIPVRYYDKAELKDTLYYSQNGTDFVVYSEAEHGAMSTVFDSLYICPSSVNGLYTFDGVAYSEYFGDKTADNLYVFVKDSAAYDTYSGDYFVRFSGAVLDEDGSMAGQHYQKIYAATVDSSVAAMIQTAQLTYPDIVDDANINSIETVSYQTDENGIIEKSQNILIALNNKPLSSLNDSFKNMTLGDLISESPDTFFSGTIMNSTLSDLGTVLTEKLSSATMGDIITWSGIAVEPAIELALNDITLVDFFDRLTITIVNGKPFIGFEL